MSITDILFSNVKGFLRNEINTALLSGANDVIVIRKSDGTYATSPWHVRFGKKDVIQPTQNMVGDRCNDCWLLLCYAKISLLRKMKRERLHHM